MYIDHGELRTHLVVQNHIKTNESPSTSRLDNIIDGILLYSKVVGSFKRGLTKLIFFIPINFKKCKRVKTYILFQESFIYSNIPLNDCPYRQNGQTSELQNHTNYFLSLLFLVISFTHGENEIEDEQEVFDGRSSAAHVCVAECTLAVNY